MISAYSPEERQHCENCSQHLLYFRLQGFLAGGFVISVHYLSIAVDDDRSPQGRNTVGPGGHKVGVLGPDYVESPSRSPKCLPVIQRELRSLVDGYDLHALIPEFSLNHT